MAPRFSSSAVVGAPGQTLNSDGPSASPSRRVPTSLATLRPSWLTALTGACGLLLAEYLALSSRFDARPLLAHATAWSALGHLGAVGPLAAAVVTGSLLFGPHLWRLLPSLSTPAPIGPRRRMALALHLGSFCLFWQITGQVFEAARPVSTLWVLSWVACGALSLALLGIVAVPLAGWQRLWRAGRHSFLAGLAVGVLAWTAGSLTVHLWDHLGPLNLRAVAALLGLFSDQVVVSPAELLVGTGTFQVIVAPVCSGYEGVGLMTVFLLIFLWRFRADLRFPRAALILPAAMCAVLAGNVLRIAALVGVGTAVSPDVAYGGFHSKAGWVLFCALFLSIIALARRSSFLSARPLLTAGPVDRPVAGHLVPFLAVLAASLMTGLLTRGMDLLYGLRVVAGAVALVVCRRTVKDLAGGMPAAGALGGFVAFALVAVLAPMPKAEAAAAWHQDWSSLSASAKAAWVVLRVCGSVLVTPLVEELAFRGYLLRRLVSRDFTAVLPQAYTWPAVLVSSLAFGLIHDGWLWATLVGVVYALAQRWRGRVTDAIVAHMITNALVTIAVLTSGEPWLWR